MTRPSLLQNDIRPPKPGRAEATSSAPDLAAWLTSDLRVKGAPSTPSAAESATAAAAIVVVPEPDAEQSAFGAWLTSDLRPRNSSSPPPPDSLAPQVVTPPMDVPDGEPSTALEADDFAVLPGRARGKRGSRRRAAVAVGALLFAGAGLWFWAAEPAPAHLEGISAAQPAAPLGALPPPPPSEVVVPPEPEVAPAPVSRGPRAAAPAEPPLPDEDDPWSGPRGRSWARYADLPSPTLSRLAREERELARKRDEQLRLEAKRAKRAE
jgi:hypothetical protein